MFQEGDKINVRNFAPGAFAPGWTGPHTMEQRTGDTTYEVLIEGKQSNIYLNYLQPARTENEVPGDETPYGSSESSDKEFEFRDDATWSQKQTSLIPTRKTRASARQEPILKKQRQ